MKKISGCEQAVYSLVVCKGFFIFLFKSSSFLVERPSSIVDERLINSKLPRKSNSNRFVHRSLTIHSLHYCKQCWKYFGVVHSQWRNSSQLVQGLFWKVNDTFILRFSLIKNSFQTIKIQSRSALPSILHESSFYFYFHTLFFFQHKWFKGTN